MINHMDGNKSFTPKPRPEEEEFSSDEDLDDWLKTEIERHMCGQDKQDEEDALVAILQSLVGECKAVYANKGTSLNIMPRSIFKHLKLANLKKTDTLVEMTDMTQKAPLGIVENVLVKINKFLIPFDFMIMDMLREPNETMILGRPFLATIHAQIDVFKSKISLGIGGDRILFDMDGKCLAL
ncbi:copia protein [Tanacetum coccineum]